MFSFGGESLPTDVLLDMSRWKDLDLAGFTKRNFRDIREPEIFDCAKRLRSKYEHLGVVGYCFGGWAVFRLGAKSNDLVNCIVAGHPTWLTKDDIDHVDIPVQVLAPENDVNYTPELKEHSWTTLQANKVTFDYQHFPGVEHACFTRGDTLSPADRKAMARGKNAAVSWFRQFLYDAD